MNTFSSKWPCIAPTVIAASFPITWADTCVTTSGMTGFTLPGMIELPFWSSGSRISARPARGPEPMSRRSFAIFVSETATVFSAPRRLDERVARRLRLERVGGRRDRRGRSRPSEPLAHAGGEFGMRVQAGADRGAAERDLADAAERRLDARDPLAHLRGVAAELLAERDRDGVHQVRAAGLHDVGELLGLRLERRRQAGRAPGAGRSWSSPSAPGARPTGRRRSRTGRGSRGRSGGRPRRRARRSPRSRSCSGDVPEPVWKTSIGNWSSNSPAAIRSPADCDPLREVRVEQPELGVHPRGRGLDASEPAHDRGRHRLAGHGKVLDGLHGLAAPELLWRRVAHVVESIHAGSPVSVEGTWPTKPCPLLTAPTLPWEGRCPPPATRRKRSSRTRADRVEFVPISARRETRSGRDSR